MSAQGSVVPVDGTSHVSGTTERPLVDATLPAFLKEVVRRHGDRTAAVFCQTGDRWTYDQLSRRTNQLAAGLLSIGLYKGDRIGIWAPNRPEWLIAQFATARIGLILVNINPAYKSSELEYALNKVEAKALILAHRFKSSDYVGTLQELAPEMANSVPGRLQAKRLPALQSVIQLDPDPAYPVRFHSTGLWIVATTQFSPGSTPYRLLCRLMMPSIFNSRQAPPARRRVQPCRISTSSTMLFPAPVR